MAADALLPCPVASSESESDSLVLLVSCSCCSSSCRSGSSGLPQMRLSWPDSKVRMQSCPSDGLHGATSHSHKDSSRLSDVMVYGVICWLIASPLTVLVFQCACNSHHCCTSSCCCSCRLPWSSACTSHVRSAQGHKDHRLELPQCITTWSRPLMTDVAPALTWAAQLLQSGTATAPAALLPPEHPAAIGCTAAM